MCFFFFFQAEDGIRDVAVTGVQTCALPIFYRSLEQAISGRAAGRAVQQARGARGQHTDSCAGDRKSTRLNSSHGYISYAVFCLKKKKQKKTLLYDVIF